jgi:hypothetical protein
MLCTDSGTESLTTHGPVALSETFQTASEQA